MPDPKPDDVDLHEETTDPLVADVQNFYKVEKWTRDGTGSSSYRENDLSLSAGRYSINRMDLIMGSSMLEYCAKLRQLEAV
jgi:hypothetical protein